MPCVWSNQQIVAHNVHAAKMWLPNSTFRNEGASFGRHMVIVLNTAAGKGVAEVVRAIRIERKGRDVYVMGAANVGKSAFVR